MTTREFQKEGDPVPATTATEKRTRGAPHPIEHIAAELGVDRKTLTRRLEEIGVQNNGSGVTFREAFRALTNRQEEEQEARATKRAVRESAEIEAAKQKGLFVLRRNHENILADLAIQSRVVVEGADYIPHASRKRLSKDLAGIRVEPAEAAE